MFVWHCITLVCVLTGVLREVTTHFAVDTRAHSIMGGNHIKVRIVNPSGANTDAYITDKGDGTYKVEYTAYEDGKRSSTYIYLFAFIDELIHKVCQE